MNEILLFSVGALMACVFLLLGAFVFLSHKAIKTTAAEKEALQKTLADISEVHNNLVESIGALDKKLGDTSLRVDMIQSKKPSGDPKSNSFFAMGKI